MTYLFSIRASIAWFPILALLFTVPFLIVQYHKYGSVNLLRAVILYSFIFYLLTIYFLVILPLPKKSDVTYNPNCIKLIPFRFILDFLKESPFVWNNPSTYLKAIASPSFYTVIFNFFMTIPYGMYLRYYFKCNLKQTIKYSFFLSLFFELTQLSGLYGIYPYPYRVFDVDDLIINTLGGIIGYYLLGYVQKILPTREEIDQASFEKGQSVTGLRRILAFLLDSLTYLFISLFLSIFWQTKQAFQIAFLIYFIFVPCIKGDTLWYKFLKISLKFPQKKLLRKILRNIFLFFYYYWLPFIMAFLATIIKETYNLTMLFPYYYLVVLFLLFNFYVCNIAIVLIKKKKV